MAMSFVADEFKPSFSSVRVIVTCSVSTTNADTPRALRVSLSVRANSSTVPPSDAFVIHCFAPRDLPALVDPLRARDEAPASEPEPDSVSAKQPTRSPRASGGTKRARCSSVPNRSSGSVQADVCTATVTPTPASPRESSSSTRMYERKSAPAPPYSSGTHTPISPSDASEPISSRGKPWSRSHAAACGSISERAKSRASDWISRCSAVSSKSTAGTLTT